MPENDRQAVAVAITAVRSATLHASSHSSDLSAYTHRLADHLLSKAAPTSSTGLARDPALPSRHATLPLSEPLSAAPGGEPVAQVSTGLLSALPADGPTPMEDEGLAARVWQALAGSGTGWDNQHAVVSHLLWACVFQG